MAIEHQSLQQLVDELRLVEREDGGSTRYPGSARAEELAAEITRRIKTIDYEAGATCNRTLINAVSGEEADR